METARKGYSDPENVDDPMIAPQDYDVRQSGRVLELQNRGLWKRRTDLSWHFHILVTIREVSVTNYRGRSAEKLKAREDKIEEAKKKTKTGDDEWQSSSWSWQQATTWASSSSSSWQQWSPDQTRERFDWQTADWNSSDQVRKGTAWQSHYLWQ